MGKGRNEKDDQRLGLFKGYNQVPAAETECLFKVYHRRWYVLLVFILSGMASCTINYTWDALARSAQRAFGWSGGQLTLLRSWCNTVPIITSFIVYWVMSEKGLRYAMLMGNVFLFIGASLRCITFSQPYVTWLMNLGQLISSFAFNLVLAGAPVLSANWFSSGQRVLATSLASQAYFLGLTVPHVLTMLFITCSQDTNLKHGCSPEPQMQGNLTIPAPDYKLINQHEIMNIMYAECGVAAFVLILVAVYFPSKPPLPPDVVASIERLGFMEGVKSLGSIKVFWVLAIIYALVIGFGEALKEDMAQIVQSAGFTMMNIDLVMIVATLFSCVCLPIIGFLADHIYKHLKSFLVILFVAIALFSAWIALMLVKVIPQYFFINFALPFTGLITSINLAIPIAIELACEVTYPAKEGLGTGVVNWMMMPTLGIVLLFMKIPHIGKVWLLFSLIGLAVVSVVILIAVEFKMLRRETKIKYQLLLHEFWMIIKYKAITWRVHYRKFSVIWATYW